MSSGFRRSSGAASSYRYASPRAVAASRPYEPSSAIGFPVTHAGVCPWNFPYSSIIQAIVWAFVPTSGAGMSRCGPSTFTILPMKERAIFSRSSGRQTSTEQLTPPLAPPNGIPAIAVFHVMRDASARTSSRSTSGWNRTPPLYGPRAPLCWTR